MLCVTLVYYLRAIINCVLVGSMPDCVENLNIAIF